MVAENSTDVIVSLETVSCLDLVLRQFLCVLVLVLGVMIQDQDHINPVISVFRLLSRSSQQD